MYTYYQPGTGPARTGLISTGRFRPYGMSCGRLNDHRNAEAGPSTLVPSPSPYVGHPTQQPSGGMISETTASAEIMQTTTEEDKVPVSKFYCSHIPRVIECSFGVRRPNGPSAPVAKDHLAATAYRCGRTPPNCATECSGERDSGKPQPSTRL